MNKSEWNAADYDTVFNYIWERGQGLLDLLQAQKGARVLDVGCGTGHLTEQLAKRGYAVVGMDSSTDMVEQARANYPHIDFRTANAADFDLDGPFDALFSNATLHWVKRVDESIACMARCLRVGGEFVVEFGGRGNVASIVDALTEELRRVGIAQPELRSPWYFPSVGAYASRLEEHGFAVRVAQLFERPTPLEGGEDGLKKWFDMFAGSWLSSLSFDQKRDVIARVEDALRSRLFCDGAWVADYRRLRVVAVREG